MKKTLAVLATTILTLSGLAHAQVRPMQQGDLPESPINTDSLQAPRFNCDKPVVNPERPVTVKEAEKYRQPDLSWPGNVAITSQLIDLGEDNFSDSQLELGFVAQLDNFTFCDAKESRVKAILTLAGGRWLGEARVDLAVARRSSEAVHFEMDVPLSRVIKDDCTLNRDDYVLTLKADFRSDVSELDETNNTFVYDEFATASDNICPRETDSN